MRFKHCLFFIATALFTFSVAIPVTSGGGSNHSGGSNHRLRYIAKVSKGNPSLRLTKNQKRQARRMGLRDKHESSELIPTPPPSKEDLECLKDIAKLPHPDDKFSAAGKSYSGQDVINAIANSYRLHHNAYPKPFYNQPYHWTHPDHSLHGKHVIPHDPDGPSMWVFPVTNQTHGWFGKNDPGPARAVLAKRKDGKMAFCGVVSHDAARGGPGHEYDHYLATHTEANK